VTEQQIRDLLSATYPRIREAGRGWALETAPNVLVPVPDPGDKLAYLAAQGRWSKHQLFLIQIALQKRVPVPPEPATIFYLEQLLA
jgi:hypothetical protein